MVDEVTQSQLFAVIFNNELIKVNMDKIFTLRHYQKNEWEDDSHLINMFNATCELDIKS